MTVSGWPAGRPLEVSRRAIGKEHDADDDDLVLIAAGPGEIGTHFIQPESDAGHRCRPACYRVNRHGITLLCEAGHSAGHIDTGKTYAGSAMESLLNRLPVFAPYRQATTEEIAYAEGRTQ